MNLQSMDYIITTANEKSITRAAKRLNITQQTLSAHISSLEEELGCRLFIRHVPLELTYAGKEFLKYAHRIQNQVTELNRTFHAIAGEEKGVLKIGVTHARGKIILPAVMMDFCRKHPGIDLNVIENANDILIQDLRKGELDVCISDFASYHSHLNQASLYREKIVFVCQKQLFCRLFRDETKHVIRQIQEENRHELLERCPLLISQEQDISGKCARRVMETFEHEPLIRAEATNIELLLKFCVNGLGGCFCPDIIARNILTEKQLSQVFILTLGEEYEYDIQIGWKDNWHIISSFVNSSIESLRENPC